MAFQAAPNIAQVRVEGQLDAQLTINDFYFEVSGGGITPTNLSTLTFAVGDWYGAQIMPNLSQDFTASVAVGVDLGSPTGVYASAPIATPGGIASESSPNNVAACVSIRTAQRGRSGRGRNYLPGVPNGQVTLNTMSAPFMNAIIDAYLMLIGAGTFVAGWQYVVLSRRTGSLPRPNGIGIPVTGVQFTTPYVRSMRSREVGHGA